MSKNKNQPAIVENDVTGVVVKWKSDRGYGFIRRDTGGPDVFVHVKSLVGYPTVQELASGDRVAFDLAEGGAKGDVAVNVQTI